MRVMRLPFDPHTPSSRSHLRWFGHESREQDMRKTASIFVILIACAVCQTSPAEDPAVAAAYGTGVHSFYSGNYQQSHDALSRVVAIGTEDPRVYYFRGLAALRLGRRDEAIADFSEGADLEAAGWSIRTVSRSLERVQGPDRLLLERSRNRARLAIAQAQRPASRMGGSAASLSGPRFSGIGGNLPATTQSGRTPQATGRQDPIDSPSEAEIDSAKEPMQRQQPQRTPTPPGPASDSKTPAKPDPFGDDPFTADPFGPGMNSSRRGRSDTQRDQIDAQNELRAAEATDVLDQREAMAERDAAAGDR
jgi:tetratricopeptide (TPR) repeat protein